MAIGGIVETGWLEATKTAARLAFEVGDFQRAYDCLSEALERARKEGVPDEIDNTTVN
jgi:hypothetical protein